MLLVMLVASWSGAETWKLAQLDHTSWTSRDGAPLSIVQIAQDKDGTLWIASEGGLYNFDGRTFTSFQSLPGDSVFPSFSINSLYVSKNGSLGEALRNAFRHAQARQIEVALRYDETQFRLRIRDNGKGIDPKILIRDGRAGHYGLSGMRERAMLIGGKLTVWSEQDSGTEVELSVPATSAYATSPRRSWLLEKFF
jgi:hypothetical protein